MDATGHAYVVGATESVLLPADPFPTTPGAVQTMPAGGGEAFVSKLDPAGSAFVYSTLLGGAVHEHAWDVAVDAAGQAYVVGTTQSANFPSTPGAFQPQCARSVLGSCSLDVFVSRLAADGTSLVYSTRLGGSGDDEGLAIAVDDGRHAFVTGKADRGSVNTPFPTTPGAYRRTAVGFEAFVSRLDPAGATLVYSTFVGPSFARAIAVDPGGTAYLTGQARTGPTFAFPTTADALQPAPGPSAVFAPDAFVALLDGTGSTLVYASYLGGGGWDEGYGIGRAAGGVFVAGKTESENFPVMNAAQPTKSGGGDGFVVRFTHPDVLFADGFEARSP